ncbi:hypothetical protein HDF17_002157 [Granulicella arctica]|uniref:Uncharacterized protein n=1 Tax=Granulicella arctica TaxID=940613 RepID=A0A7Y9PH78_9BACT|nr:hypothetical protein [Granulicella arctica]
MPLKWRIGGLAWFQEFSMPLIWFLTGEEFGVVDTVVLEAGYVEHVVGAEGV